MSKKAHAFPFGLLGSLALVAAIEAAITRQGDFLATYSGLATRFAARQADTQDFDGALIGLGDSTLKFGFDPQTASKSAGVRAYNLAVPGTPPPLAVALLNRALERGAKPKGVVVGVLTFSGNPGVHVNEFAEVFSPREAFELARDAERSSLFAEILLAKALAGVRYRHALCGSIFSAIQGESGFGHSQTLAKAKLATWTEHNGHEPRANGDASGRLEANLERGVYTKPWLIEAAFEKGFRKLFAIADRHEIPVYWLIPPIAPDAQKARDVLNLDAPHTRNLQAILGRLPNATLVDARRFGFDANDFFDPTHLNAQGAAKLTEALTSLILDRQNNQTPQKRWVALTPASGSNTKGDLATRKAAVDRR